MTRLLHGCTVTLLSAGVLLAACGETTPTGVCDPSDPSCNPTDTTTTTTSPLTVLDVSPSDGATGVGTGATVTVTFNRVIAAASAAPGRSVRKAPRGHVRDDAERVAVIERPQHLVRQVHPIELPEGG